MRRFNYRMLLAVSAAAFAGLLLSANQADARWGSSGSSGGSWGSSGSSGGSWGSSGSSGGGWVSYGSSGSSGSSGGSWGSSGSSGGSWGGRYRTPVRTTLRVVLPPYGHRRYYNSSSSGGSWGSSGSSGGGWVSYGSSGSSGSSGGSWGSSGSSGGSWGSSYSVDGDDDQAQPVNPQAQPQPKGDGTPPLPKAPGDAKPMAYYGDPDSVLINVSLPEGTKLFVNGNATRSMGTDRAFVSRGLEAGKRYKYELRAEGENDGKTVSESKVVYVTAGDQTRLVFGLEGNDAENIAVGTPAESTPAKPVSAKASTDDKTTMLRLHVPADAQVTLSGATTKSTGPVRIFSTSKLADGQAWENYVVRAELTQNGKKVSREATISLKAGETRDLTLDFDGPQVAAVASNSAR